MPGIARRIQRTKVELSPISTVAKWPQVGRTSSTPVMVRMIDGSLPRVKVTDTSPTSGWATTMARNRRSDAAAKRVKIVRNNDRFMDGFHSSEPAAQRQRSLFVPASIR